MNLSLHLRTADHPEQKEFEVVVRASRRRRLLICYGAPPGSHIGIWRTRTDRVTGWNLRVGRRYLGPCVTILAHVGPLEPTLP